MITEVELEAEEVQSDPYLAHFTETLELVTIFEGTKLVWTLPDIDSGLEDLTADVTVEPDSQIAPNFKFNADASTLTYDGKDIGGLTGSKFFDIDIILSNTVGDNSFK